jgi:hypothetical protein
MRRLSLALAVVASLAAVGGVQARGVRPAALAKAAQAAPLKLIDYDEDRCDGRTVAQWLTALTADEAKSITWMGGGCQIVGPGIDSGSSWCGRAEVELKHAASKDDLAIVEIFFEGPVKGAPGVPYAFRAVMGGPDGLEVIRFRKEFEAVWAQRFPIPEGAIVDCRA